MLQRHIFQFPSVRDSADCVSSGRLREVKNNSKFKKSSLKVVAYGRWSLKRGGRLREVPSIVISLENVLYFGNMAAYGRWSLTRGGRKVRFDCIFCLPLSVTGEHCNFRLTNLFKLLYSIR